MTSKRKIADGHQWDKASSVDCSLSSRTEPSRYESKSIELLCGKNCISSGIELVSKDGIVHCGSCTFSKLATDAFQRKSKNFQTVFQQRKLSAKYWRNRFIELSRKYETLKEKCRG